MRDHTGVRRMSRRALTAVMTVLAAVGLFFMSALPAWAAQSVTLTFVRHGESYGNIPGAGIDTTVPGPVLTTLGQTQAATVATVLAAQVHDRIYYSDMIRTQQTADPLITAKPTWTAAEVGGFREISAGIFEGSPVDSGLGRIGYFLIPVAWSLGLRSIPIPLGEGGNEFEARFNDSIATVIADGSVDPVIFSHGAAIMAWTLMNVKNPDLGLVLSHPLGNTEQVVVTGNPEDGWTLVSYAGTPVSATPGLGTQLFVNFRDLIVAPQTAVYNVIQAVKTLNLPTIVGAIREGVISVVQAGVTFVKSTVTDIAQAVIGALPVAAQPPATSSTLGAAKPAAPVAATEVAQPQAKSGESGNGATDLSDGNKVEPTKTSRSGALRPVSDQPGDTAATSGTSGGGNAAKGTGSTRRSAEKAAA